MSAAVAVMLPRDLPGDSSWPQSATSARRRIDALHAAGATSMVLLPAGNDPGKALEPLAAVLSVAPGSA